MRTHLMANLPHRLMPEHETVVYRIVQEAVAHIQVRGEASAVAVKLRGEQGAVSVTVQADTAVVQTTDEETTGVSDVGLMALIERTELAGGDVRVGRAGDGRTVMHITVPATPRSTGAAANGQGTRELLADYEEADVRGARDE